MEDFFLVPLVVGLLLATMALIFTNCRRKKPEDDERQEEKASGEDTPEDQADVVEESLACEKAGAPVADNVMQEPGGMAADIDLQMNIDLQMIQESTAMALPASQTSSSASVPTEIHHCPLDDERALMVDENPACDEAAQQCAVQGGRTNPGDPTAEQIQIQERWQSREWTVRSEHSLPYFPTSRSVTLQPYRDGDFQRIGEKPPHELEETAVQTLTPFPGDETLQRVEMQKRGQSREWTVNSEKDLPSCREHPEVTLRADFASEA
eukprot:TRINITY_DN5271_c0_g1_i3.p1 TRINITY_DN5271_c0_g1~~TRINITY_DN5271_c0_g1_i3.p1  ORF type:complete len:266 (-),score=56.94 TRINITY_DN5271_c0_g1_i3:101-898(-)